MLILIPWWCVIWIAASSVLDPALYLSPSPPVNGNSLPWTQKRVERNTHDLSVVPIQYEKLTYGTIRATTLSPFLTSASPIPSTTSSIHVPSKPVASPPTSSPPTSLPPSSLLRTSTPPTSSPPTSPLLSLSTLVTPDPTEKQELMDKAETFWPLLRTSIPYVGIHVPLSFRLSGTYGYVQDPVDSIPGGASVISSSYVSTPNKQSGIHNLYDQTDMYRKSGLAGSSYGSYSGYGTRIFGSQGGAAWSGWGNGKWGHYGKG